MGLFMRWMQYTLLLLLLICTQAIAQQYSSGACLLLQQQIDRFASQPQNANYRNARREYDKYCLKPVSKPPVSNANRETAEPVLPQLPRQLPPQPQPQTYDEPTPTDQAAQLPQAEPELEPQLEQALDQEHAAAEVVNVPPIIAPSTVTTDGNESEVSEDIVVRILNNLPLIIANIFAWLLVLFLMTSWFGLNLPGFKGVFAEYKLNRLLRWRLSRGYHHFRKLKLLTAKDELVMIDHLVLSPFGIFVIMVKDYRGHIFGSEEQANWMRQYFGNKKQFMNPLHENFKHVAAVKNLLQLQGTDVMQHVHSIIAFSRVAQFKTELPANITYIDAISAYLKQFDDPCFNDEQLSRFAALFSQASTDN
jgi:hypothetical protein